MKLPVENEMPKEKTEMKIKKNKLSKKNGQVKDTSEAVAKALKKPRTRSVSLTLSENGINEELETSLPDKKGKNSPAKSKKVKKVGDKTEKKMKVTADQPAGQADKEKSAVDEVPPEHGGGRFSNFPIRGQTISKLKAKGVKYLFPVQAQTFIKVLEGQDIVAKARTGTGKTLAFALPLIEKLEVEGIKTTRGRPPRVLVLAPTRELVNQVAKDFKSLSSLSIHAFYGGVPLNAQGTALRSGIDILVGTPGRLLDWIDRGQLDTSQLEHVVLDEVDQMLDMGFAEDVEKIISFSYNRSGGIPNPQTLLFSATLPDWVKRTAQKYMDKMPPVIDLVGSSLNQTATNVTYEHGGKCRAYMGRSILKMLLPMPARFVHVHSLISIAHWDCLSHRQCLVRVHLAIRSHWNDHASDISKIIQYYSGDNGRAMVFCHTKNDVNELAMCPEIKQNKEKLHGDVKQATRESVLEQFRQGKVKVLVTTNVAARGLHIPEVDVVIQTSPPTDIESYIHRSGRTGRAGKSGISICLFTNRTEPDLIQVERRAKIVFKRVGVPSVDQLVSQGMKELYSSIDEIDVEVLVKFREMASELIAKKGAEDAVAALIALSTGQTKNRKVSLINSREGLITLLYTTNATIQFKGYVYNMLQKISYEMKQKVLNMALTKDSKGAVFDLPLDTFQEFESQLLFETKNESLVVATELPELQTNVRSFNSPASQGWKPRGGGRGNSSWGGGAKRSFQQTTTESVTQNKRVKFD